MKSLRISTWLRSLRQFLAVLFSDAVTAFLEWSWLRRIAVITGLVVFLLLTLLVDVPPLTTLREWADGAGNWFPILFWFGYVLITQFPVPRTILTLSAGVLFGPWVGIILALSATTLSAAISLSVVRGLLGEWIRPRLTHPAVVGIDARLRQRGWLAVTSLRMIAGVPFSILNYVAALTSVPLLPFALATLIGSAPGTVLTVLLGNTFTGEADPLLLGLTIALAILGIIGLALDTRLPVKP
ncbi:TVP38/TMEM64 family inner membrane protein YdjZ [Corynebacterium occultum]|uniref:TVP38/TMEM64 family membrane protein n=1 Tax=Corynebacterium occultum TaxID=2675219 RepID=A0A6B8W813_9CORY|nr:TVP38/TMEM64 family protein [Corynebacterium occultum]QGU07435.1 TVP38/TMEM64 family inner membrane protein YdjZ [Corynebacterium occultum]